MKDIVAVSHLVPNSVWNQIMMFLKTALWPIYSSALWQPENLFFIFIILHVDSYTIATLFPTHSINLLKKYFFHSTLMHTAQCCIIQQLYTPGKKYNDGFENTKM